MRLGSRGAEKTASAAERTATLKNGQGSPTKNSITQKAVETRAATRPNRASWIATLGFIWRGFPAGIQGGRPRGSRHHL